MALKCIDIDNRFQVPTDGFYQLIIPSFEVQSMYINVYDDLGVIIQTLGHVCNYAFYFTSGETIRFKGSIIIEERSKFKFKINQVGSSEDKVENSVEQQCVHDWKEYVGIINRFTYCSKCDVKGE
jgi:hypothetical protein